MPWLYDIELIVEGNYSKKKLGDNKRHTGADCYSANCIDGSAYITLGEWLPLILIPRSCSNTY